MNLKQIGIAIYATYLTNKYGFKLKKVKTSKEKKALRIEYSETLLSKLNISVEVLNKEKLPKDGNYLLMSNHRSIIDPLIIELALRDSKIHGFWVSKKELFNSFFFGTFTRNADTVLLDRESANMSSFFGDIKDIVKNGHSIFIFPEGTRSLPNRLRRFQRGAARIALQSGCAVVPVTLRCEPPTLMKGQHWYQIAEQRPLMTVQIHDPLDITNIVKDIDYEWRTSRRLTQYFQDFFESEWKTSSVQSYQAQEMTLKQASSTN